jgi:hypothetical protein
MTKSTSIFHSFSRDKETTVLHPLLFIILFVFIVLGVGTGYLLAQSRTISSANSINGSSLTVGSTYGSDNSSFKDTAEGVLQTGGVQGEGQYHLIRSGGDSQNVYLTSSVVDLSQFVGHKVKVWGATQQAQHAGWLMDVGKVEVES